MIDKLIAVLRMVLRPAQHHHAVDDPDIIRAKERQTEIARRVEFLGIDLELAKRRKHDGSLA